MRTIVLIFVDNIAIVNNLKKILNEQHFFENVEKWLEHVLTLKNYKK